MQSHSLVNLTPTAGGRGLEGVVGGFCANCCLCICVFFLCSLLLLLIDAHSGCCLLPAAFVIASLLATVLHSGTSKQSGIENRYSNDLGCNIPLAVCGLNAP